MKTPDVRTGWSRNFLQPVIGPWAVSAVMLWGVVFAVAPNKTGSAAEKEQTAQVDFDHEIRPILASKCIRCHGPGVQESGLRLDRAQDALRLLDSGEHAIVPGKPDESELLRRIGADESERMPPTGELLTAAEIELLRNWISEGTPWPEHWAYRPLTTPQPPRFESQLKGAELEHWVRTPVDRFILQKLLDNGMQPAPEADRRTLIRRLSFDLCGLPPLPEEVQAFVDDPAPDAYEQLVERLLASSHYGERWARHWMDVVHYADSHGFEHDLPRQIWPYRDYLVQYFNQDRPFATFIREQIAGDVLFPEDPVALTATGFLATGPWDLSAQQAGNADSIDKVISQYQDRDDVVSTVMSTFVSSTVHCARCHDHKFDPISQADYYALQAVFAGIDKAHRLYDPDPKVAEQRLSFQNALAHVQQLLKNHDESLLSEKSQSVVAAWEAKLRAKHPQWQVLEQVEFHSEAGSTLTLQPDGSLLASGARPETDIYTIATRTSLPQINMLRLEVLADDSLPKHGPGRQENGNLHLNEFQVKVALITNPEEARPLKLASAKADFDQAGGWSIDRAIDQNATTAWGIYPQVGKSHTAVFHLAEPLDHEEQQLLIFELRQTHGGGHLIGRLRLSVANVGNPEATEFSPLPSDLAQILDTPPQLRTPHQKMTLAGNALQEVIREQLAALPAQQSLYCGTNRFTAEGGFRPASTPRDVYVLIRGEISQPGPLASSGTLHFVPGLPGDFKPEDSQSEGSRRETLANWLADERNVLTWRVIANRIWQYHFGTGIVATPSDFGRMGASPTHPELLDWLAATFRDQGGSIKSLHRLLVNSATYRQSSGLHQDFSAMDAGNRFLWRMNRQRLDADCLHDAVLLLCGQLNPQMEGPPIKQFIETKTFNLRPEADYLNFNVDDPGNRRRSLYRFMYRTIPDPFMSALDCPDGTQLTPVRNESMTALQALAMLNDKFIIRQCEHLAETLAREQKELPDQIRQAYQILLSRPPRQEELTWVCEYAGKFGVSNTLRYLMNTNEFIFVD